jgi:hypothetical protein
MRIEGFQGGFMPLSGGAFTGPITISANQTPLLTINRPDGAAASAIKIQSAGADQAIIDAVGGVMSAGVVPLARMKRTEVTAGNAGLVTITAGTVTVASINLGTVNAGDRVLIFSRVRWTKGVTGGTTNAYLTKTAGTSTVVEINDETAAEWSMTGQPASETRTELLCTVVLVTASGTLTFSVNANSAGSDSTCTAGNCDLYGLVLNNG